MNRDELAAAWDEGYAAAIDDYGCDVPWGGTTSDENPYRPHVHRWEALRSQPPSWRCRGCREITETRP